MKQPEIALRKFAYVSKPMGRLICVFQFPFRSIPVPFQFNSIERKWIRKGMGLNGNGPGMEQVWNGNGTERELSWNGMGTEREWNCNGVGMERNGNGMELEQKFNGRTMNAQFKVLGLLCDCIQAGSP